MRAGAGCVWSSTIYLQNLAELVRSLLCLLKTPCVSSLCTFALSISLLWNAFFPVYPIFLILQCRTHVLLPIERPPWSLPPTENFSFSSCCSLTVFAMHFADSFCTVMCSFPNVSFALVLPLPVDCIHSIFLLWSSLSLQGKWIWLCSFSNTDNASEHSKQFLCVV